MAERSSISQAVQVGVESTPGTAVAATRRLGSIGVELGVQAGIATRRPIGTKYPTLAVLGKEWSEGSLSGSPVYTELPYLLGCIFGAPTTEVINDTEAAPAATRWTFTTSNFDADQPKTLTVEQGDSVRAHRASNGVITDLSMSVNRDEVGLEGTMLAKAIEDGITLSPGATQLPQVPVRPSEFSLYLDDDSAVIGTTKLTRAISSEFSLASRFTPVWVVDAAQDSFVTTIEGEPEVGFNLMQQANAEGMENLQRMRAGGTVFLRMHAVGPTIATGASGAIRHEFILDVAGQINEPNPFSDEDGVYAVQWGFAAVFDPTWGHAIRAEVVTSTMAL